MNYFTVILTTQRNIFSCLIFCLLIEQIIQQPINLRIVRTENLKLLGQIFEIKLWMVGP